MPFTNSKDAKGGTKKASGSVGLTYPTIVNADVEFLVGGWGTRHQMQMRMHGVEAVG